MFETAYFSSVKTVKDFPFAIKAHIILGTCSFFLLFSIEWDWDAHSTQCFPVCGRNNSLKAHLFGAIYHIEEDTPSLSYGGQSSVQYMGYLESR